MFEFLKRTTLFRYFKSTHVKGSTTNFNCKPFLEFTKTSSLSPFLASHWLVYSSSYIFVRIIKLHFSINTL